MAPTTSTLHNSKATVTVFFRNSLATPIAQLQRVPDKMRPELVIGIHIGILNNHFSSLFKRLIWKETWTLTMQDSVLNFNDQFRSHFFGNGLYHHSRVTPWLYMYIHIYIYIYICIYMYVCKYIYMYVFVYIYTYI